jgi:hypothetical protein
LIISYEWLFLSDKHSKVELVVYLNLTAIV